MPQSVVSIYLLSVVYQSENFHFHTFYSHTMTSNGGVADPIIINLSNCRYDIIYQAARKVGFRISEKTNEEDDTWTVFWMDKSSCSERIMKLRDYQRINHFPCMDAIARKHKLTRNMKKMASKFPEDYNFYPMGFELPLERASFFRHLDDFEDKDFTFIIKPNAESCGRGIVLTKECQDVRKYDKCIVQMYVDNPLLLEGKKFDLRVYLLITCLKPLTMYMFQEGIMRICSEKYEHPTKENVKNGYIHYTNYTLNKKNKKGFNDCGFKDGMFCLGNKRDFKFFRKWLKDDLQQDPDEIFHKMEDVLCKTALSIYPHLLEKYERCMTGEKKGGTFTCFEILGFDILFDENFHPHLLEVNHSPSYNLGTKYDQELKLNLISETFMMLGINRYKRRKSLRREKLRSRKRLGKQVNEREMISVMMDSREKDVKRRKEAEEKQMKTYTRIWPNPRTMEKFKHLFQHDMDSFFFEEVVFKKKK